jgi:hypothetical protein
MKNAARQEYYVKGTESKTDFPVPEYGKKYAKELQGLLTRKLTMVNMGGVPGG